MTFSPSADVLSELTKVLCSTIDFRWSPGLKRKKRASEAVHARPLYQGMSHMFPAADVLKNRDSLSQCKYFIVRRGRHPGTPLHPGAMTWETK